MVTPHKLYQDQMRAADYYGHTLIYNGGFERWRLWAGVPMTGPNTECADDWYILDPLAGGAAVLQQAVTIVSGAYSCEVQVGASAPGGVWQGVVSPYEFANKRITISAWVNTNVAAAVHVVVRWYNTTLVTWVEGASAFHTGSGAWEKLTAYLDIGALADLGVSGVPNEPQVPIYVAVESIVAGPLTFFVDEAVTVGGIFNDGPTYLPYDPVKGYEGVDLLWLPVNPPGITAYEAAAIDFVGLNGIIPADCLVPPQLDKFVGIALQTGAPGVSVPVQFEGTVEHPVWAWLPGEAVFVAGGAGPYAPGQLFQFSIGAPPGIVWVQQVGLAVTPIKLEMRIESPELLT